MTIKHPSLDNTMETLPERSGIIHAMLAYIASNGSIIERAKWRWINANGPFVRFSREIYPVRTVWASACDRPLKESVVLRTNACSGSRQLGFTDILEAKEVMAIVEAKLEQDKIEIRYRRSARRFMLLAKARLAHQQRHRPDIAFPVRSRPAKWSNLKMTVEIS